MRKDDIWLVLVDEGGRQNNVGDVRELVLPAVFKTVREALLRRLW